MNTSPRWPTDDELSQLLHGNLSGQRQAEIEAQLEVDELLRQRLEQIAGGDSWIRRAGGTPVGEPTSEVDDFALHAAIDGLKAQSTANTMLQGMSRGSMTLSFLAPTDHPGAIGRIAHYEVFELIGCGGFGLVLRALDPKLNRQVAIKVLAPHLATHATARRRFTREAHTAASINHPHVITIHAIDDNEQTPFLVMEYVDGQSLQQLLDRQGHLDVPQILRIGSQTAAGLAAAHKQGQIHRDIKPANILLENGVQRVKITDFGLARAADDASLTQSGVIAGTPQYMAPEQARGDTVDYRADLFSLGSVLYTMCTGRPAFRADSAVAVLKRVCDDQPRPIRIVNPEIPDWLVAIVERLMAKRRDERFQSAQEVSDLLEKCLAHVQQPELVSLPDGVKHLPRPTLVAPPPIAPPPVRPADNRATEIATAARLSRGPGVGLIAAAALNLLLMMAMFVTISSHEVRGEGVRPVVWAGLLGLVAALFGGFSSAVMIVGGIQIQRRRMWPLVLVSAILSIITFGVFGSGVIMGIWTLIVLFDPRYQRGLHNPETDTDEALAVSSPATYPPAKYAPNMAVREVDRSEIQDKVWWPATCLLWIGALNLIAMLALPLIGAMFVGRSGGSDAGMLVVGAFLFVIAAGASMLIMTGASRMRQLRAWPLAVTSAILVMLTGPGCGLGLIVGIWALIVLMQPEVRAAFASQASGPKVRVPQSSSSPALVVLTVLAVIVGGPLLLGVLLVGSWFFYSSASVQPHYVPVEAEQTATLRVENNIPDLTLSVEKTNYVAPPENRWPSLGTERNPESFERAYRAGEYTIRAQDEKERQIFRADIVLRPGEYRTVKVIRQVLPKRATTAWPSKGYIDRANVRAVAISPDGKRVAWSQKSGEIVVCETEQGKEVKRFTTNDPSLVVFSPDSKTIASVGAEADKAPRSDYRVTLYNLESQEVTFLPLTGKYTEGRYKTLENVKAIAFSPDGTMVVASSAYFWTKQYESDPEFKSVVHRWKIKDGVELPPLLLQDGVIEHIAFPSGLSDTLATTSNWSTERGGTLVFWDFVNAKPFGNAHWPRRVFDGLALTPQAGWIYASYFDPQPGPGITGGAGVSIFATVNHARQRGMYLEAGAIPLDERALALAISRDGSVVAVCKSMEKIELWKTHALNPTKLAELIHANLGQQPQLQFTADNKTLLAAGFQPEVTQWDVTRFTTASEPKPVESVIPLPTLPLSPEAPPLEPPPLEASNAPPSPPKTLPIQFERRIDTPYDAPLSRVLMLPDGERVVTAGHGKDGQHLLLWNWKDGKQLHHFADTPAAALVTAATISNDGSQLAVGQRDGKVQTYDLSNNRLLHDFKAQADRIAPYGLKYHWNGRDLLSGGYDTQFNIWVGADGRSTRSADAGAAIDVVEIVPGREWTLFGGPGGKFSIHWKVDTSDFTKEFTAHHDTLTACVMLEDGQHLLTADRAGRILHWNQNENLKPLQEFSGHTGAVFSLAVFADQQHFASGSADGTIRIWSLATGQEVAQAKSEKLASGNVVVTPDGSHLISAAAWLPGLPKSEDLGLQVWKVPALPAETPANKPKIKAFYFDAIDQRLAADVVLVKQRFESGLVTADDVTQAELKMLEAKRGRYEYFGERTKLRETLVDLVKLHEQTLRRGEELAKSGIITPEELSRRQEAVLRAKLAVEQARE